MDKPLRLILAVTVSESAILLRGQLSYFREKGYDVYLVTSPGDRAYTICNEENVNFIPVEMAREISIFKDINSLFKICRIITKIKPHIVNAGTPKAGLLLLVASFLKQVPIRIYTLRGLRLDGFTGFKRGLLRACEAIAMRCAHKVICISPGLKKRILELNLLPAQKAVVISCGSSNGIDVDKFTLTDEKKIKGQQIRQANSIQPDDFVIGFIGRIVKDKGINELISAWQIIRDKFPNTHLLLVGAIEVSDPISAESHEIIETDTRIHYVGHVNDTSEYYAAMDLFVLPSYREGFGNVIIEASSMALPVISSKIPGCSDAVEEGLTGTLLPVGDISGLVEALSTYIMDRNLLRTHGLAGRERVVKYFRREDIWNGLNEIYSEMISQKLNVNNR